MRSIVYVLFCLTWANILFGAVSGKTLPPELLTVLPSALKQLELSNDPQALTMVAALVKVGQSRSEDLRCEARAPGVRISTLRLAPSQCWQDCETGQNQSLVWGLLPRPLAARSLMFECRFKGQSSSHQAILNSRLQLPKPWQNVRLFFGQLEIKQPSVISQQESDGKGTRFSIDTGAFKLLRNEAGVITRIRTHPELNFPYSNRPSGLAKLPYLVRYFAIPQGAKSVKVQVKPLRPRRYESVRLETLGKPKRDGQSVSSQVASKALALGTPAVSSLIKPPRWPIVTVDPDLLLKTPPVSITAQYQSQLFRADGLHLVRLELPLVDYNPIEKELTVYEEVKVTISVDQPSHCYVYGDKHQKATEGSGIYRKLIANPEVLAANRCPLRVDHLLKPIVPSTIDVLDNLDASPVLLKARTGTATVEKSTSTGPSCQQVTSVAADVIAVYSESMPGIDNQISRYQALKQLDGYAVVSRSLQQMAEDFGLAHLDARYLRYYLYCLHTKAPAAARPSWVVLIGDSEYIPTQYATRSINAFDQLVNAGDYFYGHFAKSLLDPALMTVGRLPVDDAQELAVLLDRMEAYEARQRLDTAGAHWQQQWAFAGLFNDVSPRDDRSDDHVYTEVMEQQLVPLASSHAIGLNRVYEASAGSDPTTWSDGSLLDPQLRSLAGFNWFPNHAVLQSSWRDRHLFLHRGHAHIDRWQAPELSVSDLDELRLANSGDAPLVLGINCLSAMFDSETLLDQAAFPGTLNPAPDAQTISLGEAMLLDEHGAIGYIGANRSSSTYANDDMARGLITAVFADSSQQIADRRFGSLLNFAKHYLASRFVGAAPDQLATASKTPTLVHEQFLIYNLLGDPTIRLSNQQEVMLELLSAKRSKPDAARRSQISLELGLRSLACSDCKLNPDEKAAWISREKLTATFFDRRGQFLGRGLFDDQGKLQQLLALDRAEPITLVVSGMAVTSLRRSL